LYGEISNTKFGEAWVLKRCQTSSQTTFVLRVLEILRSTTPASASKFEKNGQKIRFFQLYQDFCKTSAQTFNVFSFFESSFIVEKEK
jgi:hypothetical protein